MTRYWNGHQWKYLTAPSHIEGAVTPTIDEVPAVVIAEPVPIAITAVEAPAPIAVVIVEPVPPPPAEPVPPPAVEPLPPPPVEAVSQPLPAEPAPPPPVEAIPPPAEATPKAAGAITVPTHAEYGDAFTAAAQEPPKAEG